MAASGEAGRAAQHAERVLQVLRGTFEPGPAPGVARFFAKVKFVREGAAFAGGHFAMELHIAGEFTVEAAAVQQVAQTSE